MKVNKNIQKIFSTLKIQSIAKIGKENNDIKRIMTNLMIVDQYEKLYANKGKEPEKLINFINNTLLKDIKECSIDAETVSNTQKRKRM